MKILQNLLNEEEFLFQCENGSGKFLAMCAGDVSNSTINCFHRNIIDSVITASCNSQSGKFEILLSPLMWISYVGIPGSL